MSKKDKNNQNINSIPKYLLGNYFKKPIKWLAHLINDYGNSKHPFITTGTSYAYAIGDEKRRHPELTKLQVRENIDLRIKQNRKKLGLPTENTPSLAAAGLALGSLYYPWLAIPDIIFDTAASIDEPSTSNNLHTIADFPETVAKFTPSKIDDYVAKGVLTLGNIDDAVSTSGRNMFSNFDKKSGKINNTTDKTSVRESTNIRYRKNGGLIRKMLTAAGGPLRIKFDPKRIASLEYLMTRVPGMNNSGGNKYREEGVLALQYLEQETKRKEEEIKSRMEMRPTLKRKATTSEKLQGKKDEYELKPQVVGMSGADPLLSFYVGGIGLNGIGALAKTGLWNVTKYAPTTQLGNWGRGYFVGNTFKNSFNGTVPTLASQATSLLYQPVKLNESGLTSLKFFERPSKIDLATKLGLTKHEKTNLNRFLKEALEDLELYVNSGLYRLYPIFDLNGNIIWQYKTNSESLSKLMNDHAIPYKGAYINGFGVSNRNFPLNISIGETEANGGQAMMNTYSNGEGSIVLTSPRTSFEIGENSLVKSIEEAPRELPKEGMKSFWTAVLDTRRPGTYFTGDGGTSPLGHVLIDYFKNFNKKGHRTWKATPDGKSEYKLEIPELYRSGFTWNDVRERLLLPTKWEGGVEPLSTDSYLALLKQGNRPGYSLRYSPDGMSSFNNLSFANRYILDLLDKANNGEIPKKLFVDEFNKWVKPYNGMEARIVDDKIIMPHPYVYKKKQGGMLEFLKNGSGIHIKEKNKGKFTSYCGGKVTDECIRKAKASGNPTLVKRATFADNARHFKHKEGGKAFVTGVNVLDSNPKAYKYVKKKYRMALLGTKLNFFLKAGNWLSNNGDLVKSIANAGLGILSSILLNKAIDSQIEANKKLMEANKQKAFMENYKKALGLQTDRSDIINMNRAWLIANNLDYSGNEELMEENALLVEDSRNNGLLDSLGGLASSILNSSNLFKKSTNSSSLNNITGVGNSTYNWKTNTFNNKNKAGTINSNGSMNTGIGGTTYNWKTNTFGSNNIMNGFDKIKF